MVAKKKLAPRRKLNAQKTVAIKTPQGNKKDLKTSRRKNSIANKIFPIVGIGASAGGLEAVGELLVNLPPDTGMAFVIVQHLDPTHESRISEILSRKTLMPVMEIKNNARVQSNHVYVIPPNSSLRILHNIFKILPRVENKGIHLPIDSFFKSLANDQGSKCIGIILSGTASDGTYGLKAINAEGGLTIAQDPKSAKYDGMPRSAIAAGVVDLVLSPKQIGEELVRIARHPLLIDGERDFILPTHDLAKSEVEGYLGKILTLLQNKCHIDFSHYKRNTLNRRISRRMVLRKKKHLKEYLEYLETNPDEIDLLFADILINVTEFFRDPNAFTQLKTQIIPEIMTKREANLPIRIWVVGCSTGEEAYSVLMTLLEYIGDSLSVKQPIQIFATDISEMAIQKARAGIYPESISKNVSKERLQRFFVKTETGYKIKNYLREMCLFSWHDVTSDPPYAKLDLICCRNLLIYFDQALQEHVLPIFHYALKPKGFLWLGSSESMGKSLSSLFDIVDKKNKFFSRKASFLMPKFHFAASTHLPEQLEVVKKFSGQTHGIPDIERETDRIVVSKYAPPGVVINNGMEVVLIRGEVAPYLQLTRGQASLNLFKMARAELASDLRIAIRLAKKKNASARKDGCTLHVNDQIKTFSIDVIPFNFTPASQIKEQYFLISFEPVWSSSIGELPPITARKSQKQRVESQDRYIQELEQEQSDTKKYQKSLIQDFEITQEELTSANEELQSTIEELQSTNEELETAKEELQSTNEELTTVNDELQSRNLDLAKLNDDLINLLGCVDIPIVMVGLNGCVRRFTPRAGKLLNLIQSDVGRPISDINPNFEGLDLGSFVSDVIDGVAMKEMNIEDRNGHWFRLQIRPYKTVENKIDGAVISFVDINLLKQNLMESKASLDYATSIANTVRLPLVVIDEQLQMKSANHAFYKKFQTSPKDAGIDLLTLIGTSKTAISQVRNALTRAFDANVELNNLEVEYKSSTTKHGVMLLNGRRIQWISEMPNALLLSIEDITDRLKMEKSLKEAVAMAKRAEQSKDIFLATLSHELRTPLTAILCWSQLLLKMEEGSEKLRHGLESIEQNSKIQGQMIDDLLDISRIQSGKVVLSISQLDPGEVVHIAVESVQALAESKSVIIKTHLKPLNGSVAADPARLQQIVWNLLINAIKFSPPKKVIDVKVNPVLEQGKQFVAIQVIDHGKGIKPDFMPELFDRFTQGDSATTRLYGGLGLGLTIAKDLLKLLGGTIKAQSEGEGKGATFTVLLPLIPNAAKLKMKAQFDEAAAGGLWQNLNGLSVLIVEDEQNSLEAFTELLNFAGAKTISVTSAAEAMIALDKHKPDILISDIAMPGEDGISLLQRIRVRSPEEGGQIPAIALTAYAAKEDVDQAISAGFNAHLAKPFNAIDLIICVAKLAIGLRNQES